MRTLGTPAMPSSPVGAPASAVLPPALPPVTFVRPLAANDVTVLVCGHHLVHPSQEVVVSGGDSAGGGGGGAAAAAAAGGAGGISGGVGREADAAAQAVAAKAAQMPASQRCRLWWRYAIRATVLGVRRRWRIAAVDRLLEHVERTFATSLEVCLRLTRACVCGCECVRARVCARVERDIC
jgi:hypothetical protein